jgi:hypothetical protein
MITLYKRVPKKKLFSEYVRFMNGIFGLSKREAEVYSFMLKLDTEWQPLSDKDFKDILSTSNRRLISRECGINRSNLSRLVNELTVKGLLFINVDGGYEIPSKISLDPKSIITEIVFTLEVVNDETTR